MKTTPAISPKRSNLTKGIGFGFLMIGGTFIALYVGYCIGIWGRSSLLLQYFFQCNCTWVNEELRYPAQVDIVISACKESYVELSPSGLTLQVSEEMPDKSSQYYLLDLKTKEKTIITNQRFSIFLTDSLGFIESGLEDYLIDRITGLQYPIQSFRYWQENSYINGEPNLNLLTDALSQSEKVFFIRNSDTVVVLMINSFSYPDNRFTFDGSDIPGWDNERVEQFLEENQVVYQNIPEHLPNEAVSQNGKFVARADGIYLVTTGQKIVEGYSVNIFFRREYFSIRGWNYDDSGVIYSRILSTCLMKIGFPMGDGIGCFYEVPQPVVLLKVPQKYLDTPAE